MPDRITVDWNRIQSVTKGLDTATKRPEFRQCAECGLLFPTPPVDTFTSKDWLCPACDAKLKEARLTCRKCGSFCGLFPPGVTELGYAVYDRDELHLDHCPNCPRDPSSARSDGRPWDGKVKRSVILEFAEFESRLRGVPLAKILEAENGMA